MKGLCGANCSECDLFNKKCKGCSLDKKCWIANYINIGDSNSFKELKNVLLSEINSLNIDGMPKIDELYPLHGNIGNLEYLLPNRNKVKFLKDNEIYLGNQVESIFNDNENKRYFGIISNMEFILISEYDENGDNSELILYKKR